jgi:hypothetical protein
MRERERERERERIISQAAREIKKKVKKDAIIFVPPGIIILTVGILAYYKKRRKIFEKRKIREKTKGKCTAFLTFG